jgi:hypothetical protein
MDLISGGSRIISGKKAHQHGNLFLDLIDTRSKSDCDLTKNVSQTPYESSLRTKQRASMACRNRQFFHLFQSDCGPTRKVSVVREYAPPRTVHDAVQKTGQLKPVGRSVDPGDPRTENRQSFLTRRRPFRQIPGFYSVLRKPINACLSSNDNPNPN